MAKTTGSTATETEGTTGKRTRRYVRHRARGRTVGTAGGSTSTGNIKNKPLDIFNRVTGALSELNEQQRPQMLELCNRFVAQDWHGARTGTSATTETPLQGQSYAAGAR